MAINPKPKRLAWKRAKLKLAKKCKPVSHYGYWKPYGISQPAIRVEDLTLGMIRGFSIHTCEL